MTTDIATTMAEMRAAATDARSVWKDGTVLVEAANVLAVLDECERLRRALEDALDHMSYMIWMTGG